MAAPDLLAQLREEYVAAGAGDVFEAAVASVRSVSPRWVDDVQRKAGEDVYQRMMADADVLAAYDTLVLGALEPGWSVVPALQPSAGATPSPEEEAAIEQAAEIAAFVERSIERSDPPFRAVVKSLLEAVAYGSKCAEIVLTDGDGEDAGRLTLAGLRPKSASSVDYLVDATGRLVGVVPRRVTPAEDGAARRAGVADVADALPPEKFVVLTYRPQDGDPRGRSALRPAYLPWFMKTQTLPEFFTYLKKFSSPQVVGVTSKDEPAQSPQVGEDGRPVVGQVTSREALLLRALLSWRNAWAVALPPGTTVELKEASGNGEAFRDALAWFGREIQRAILGTAQATTEAQHESRSSKQVAKDVLQLRTADLRDDLSELLTRSLSRLLVTINFGPEAAALAPRIEFAWVDSGDRWDALKAAASAGYAIDPSQYAEIDAMLGLPVRDVQGAMDRAAEAAARQAATDAEQRRLFDPTGL